MELKDEKEERALDALISASLFPSDSNKDLTDSEIEAYLSNKKPLPPELQEILEEIGDDIGEVLESPDQARRSISQSSNHVEDSLYVAMNRKNEKSTGSDEEEAELKKKRAELLKKLADKKPNKDSSTQ